MTTRFPVGSFLWRPPNHTWNNIVVPEKTISLETLTIRIDNNKQLQERVVTWIILKRLFSSGFRMQDLMNLDTDVHCLHKSDVAEWLSLPNIKCHTMLCCKTSVEWNWPHFWNGLFETRHVLLQFEHHWGQNPNITL